MIVVEDKTDNLPPKAEVEFSDDGLGPFALYDDEDDTFWCGDDRGDDESGWSKDITKAVVYRTKEEVYAMYDQVDCDRLMPGLCAYDIGSLAN